MDLRSFIRDIPDFPKKGILFRDITPLLADPQAFRHALDGFKEHYQHHPFDALAAAESRGFLFAAPLAVEMHRPLILLRKPGKLPPRTLSFEYELEYGRAELCVSEHIVKPGWRVLLVDDLLATGGTMEAGAKLIEKAGGVVAGCAFLIELRFLNGRDKLSRYPIFSQIEYP